MNEVVTRFIQNRDGTVDFVIRVPNVKLKRFNPLNPWWSIVDHEERLDGAIVCEGTRVRPKVVLKVYCKPSQSQQVGIARNISIRSLRERGKRMLIGGSCG